MLRAFSRFHFVSGVILLLILAGAFWMNLRTGVYALSSAEIWSILWGEDAPQRAVVMQLRLPRALLAITAGAILAIGGFLMQALIRNPLADPYIMGLTAGAGWGVNLLVLGVIPLSGFTWLSYPAFAGLGALASVALVLVLGFRSLLEDSARLLIAGVAVSAIFAALTGLLIYLRADDDQLRQIVFWTFGSFHRATPGAAGVGLVLMALTLLFGWLYAPRLDLLQLGEAQAHSLGMQVPAARLLLLLAVSLSSGGIVAFTGPVGFVGMMIPHVCRALWGSAHRPNILLGALLGGAYLCACDVLSRWLLPPAGLPVGVVTALLGAPFFLYILFSKRRYL